MITLINNSKNFAVTDESQNFKLIGEAQCVVETGIISNFNGHFEPLDGGYSGNFTYNETTTGRANKNIYDTDKDYFIEIDTLLNTCITELKNVLNDNE
jgi:hypothetical protein